MIGGGRQSRRRSFGECDCKSVSVTKERGKEGKERKTLFNI